METLIADLGVAAMVAATITGLALVRRHEQHRLDAELDHEAGRAELARRAAARRRPRAE